MSFPTDLDSKPAEWLAGGRERQLGRPGGVERESKLALKERPRNLRRQSKGPRGRRRWQLEWRSGVGALKEPEGDPLSLLHTYV